jgi:hypothetical protein
MAIWVPPDKVGMNERIGRRIYDEPMLKGAQGQPSYSGIELHHFQGGKELSLDRLGASGIDRRIRQHLELRAEAAGARRGKPSRFDGWFHVAAKELEQARTPPKLPLIASPIREPEPDDNIYHAHVVQPDNVLPNLVSLHIRHIFTKYGEVVQNEQKQRAPTGWREWMMACLSSITRSLWPK